MKPLIVIALVMLVGLTSQSQNRPRARDLGPVTIIWLITLLVILLERDLGTGLLYFGLFIAMLYVSTGRTSWALLGILALVGGAWAVNGLSSVIPKLGIAPTTSRIRDLKELRWPMHA